MRPTPTPAPQSSPCVRATQPLNKGTNRVTPPTQTHPVQALTDSDLQQLHTLLDTLPAPLQPLDLSALDGFLCGVLLQPRRVPAAAWLPFITDLDGRTAPSTPALQQLHGLVQRRYAELDLAIGERQWFDPWIYELDGTAVDAGEDSGEDRDADEDDGNDESSDHPVDSVLPWVAGFAAAMEHFPALMDMDHPELVEPLALLFMHFAAEDLEDADALLAVIETLEPPKDLPEAVQDVVRALMLIADVTRPQTRPLTRPNTRPAPPPRRPTGAARTAAAKQRRTPTGASRRAR
jgi:uncharacterized protein